MSKADVISPFLINTVLEEKFGLRSFRKEQTLVIDQILAGKHTLALLPTGYGKSLCYQVLSQILPGATIVVSPLISLMQDQLKNLKQLGIANATCINSNLNNYELNHSFEKIIQGQSRLIYIAPERFESSRFRELISSIKVSLLVIDEAHCISQWGHDFRPQYRNLSTYFSQLKGSTLLALTATATPQVQRDIVQTLGLSRMQIVSANFDRPNIFFQVKSLNSNEEKDNYLSKALIEYKGSSIIFTASRKEAEKVSDKLKSQGFQSEHYHAGMDKYARQNCQEKFATNKIDIIVSTVAFGMGIDKANVRQVIHYNMPASLENYYQEAGRAGRDSKPSTCTLLYQNKDANIQRWLLNKNYPSSEEVLAVQQFIKKQGMNTVKPIQINRELNLAEPALNTALVFLRQQHYIDCTVNGEYFDRSQGSIINSINISLIEERKRKDFDRLEKMISYAKEFRCRRHFILDYFGQSLQDKCSGCDLCNKAR